MWFVARRTVSISLYGWGPKIDILSFSALLNCQARKAPSLRQKYIRYWILSRAWNIDSDISSIPLFIYSRFVGVKSAKFGLNFRPQLLFSRPLEKRWTDQVHISCRILCWELWPTFVYKRCYCFVRQATNFSNAPRKLVIKHHNSGRDDKIGGLLITL